MMNNLNNSKGKSWKVAIFLPVAALMLMAFGNNRSELPPKSSTLESPKIAQEKKIWTESDFKTIPINELNDLEKHDFIHENWYVVLMDRKSRVMMDNELTESNEISTKMNKMLEDALAKVSSNSKNETKAIATKVLIRTDIATDPSDYNKLLTVLANSFIDARKKLSESKFNMSYDNLNAENRRVIDTMIPMGIYIAYPNQARGKTATEVPSIRIDITPKGIFLNDELATLEKMKSKISKQVAEKPETVISVRVGIGVSDKQVNEVKNALRETRALHINYSTDFKEKGQIGKIQPPSIVIDIKANGIYYKNELVDLDGLKERITQNVAMDPNQIVTLNVAPEVKMGEVSAVKQVFREAGVLNFKYSTDVGEKDYLIKE